jgi:MFS transporter, SP family, arabinose:H+ symporter
MRLSGTVYLILICITAGLGGFLFGFDTAVISGAINYLRTQFSLSPAMEGWLMSSALLGCVGGAAIAGWLSDKYGRKKILLLSAVLFIISAVWCAIAPTPTPLIIARIIGGVGVGFAAMVAPMFISELSPASLRGRLVSVYQLSITLGILCSYLSNGWLLHIAANGSAPGFMHYYMVAEVWRALLGSNMVPAILFFVLLLMVPESPRWLITNGKDAQAHVILTRINGMEKARIELQQIKETVSTEDGNFKQLFEKKWRVALIIGIALPFLSQLSGITTVMYYAPAIFEKAGFRGSAAMGSAALIGFFNMIFTVVAIWKIDVWGRKPLLIFGFVALSIALFVIGWLFYNNGSSKFLIGGFIYYIAVFAATLGPGVWVVISEIYPTKIRGRAMSVATLTLFVGSTFVTQTYPILRESLGIGITFMLYAIMMLPAAWFVFKFIPETKGKTLEEIEHYWQGKSIKVKKRLPAISCIKFLSIF